MIWRQVGLYLCLLLCTAVVTTYAYFLFRGEWILFYEGEKLYHARNYPAAVEKYKKAMGQGAQSQALVFHLGDSLIALKRFDEAIAEYRAFLRVHPDDKVARLRLEKALSYAGKYEESIEEGRKLLEQHEKEGR